MFSNATFTRNSVAFLSDGVQALTNKPRYEQGKFGKGIMIEEGTTHYGDQFNNGSFNSGVIGTNVSGVTLGFSERILSWQVVYDQGYSGLGARCSMTTSTAGKAYFGFSLGISPVSVGQIWTFQYKYKILSQSHSSALNDESVLQCYDASGTYLGHADGIVKKVTPIRDGWNLVTMTGTIIANTTTFYPRVRMGCNTNCSIEYLLDDLQAEQKAYATSYINTTRQPDRLFVPIEGILNKNEGTIEIWTLVNDIIKRADGNPRRIFHIGTAVSSNNAGLLLFHAADSANWSISATTNGTSYNTANASDSVTPNGWHLFSVTWNSSSVKLYIDGILRATINSGITADLYTDIHIGRRNDGSRFANTVFDDLRISNVARSDAEILAAYQSNTPFIEDKYTTCLMNMDDTLRYDSTFLVDTLSVYNEPSHYRLYLCKPNKEIISILDEAYNITPTINLVNLNELTFTIPYLVDGEVNPNFDLIKGDFLIFLEQIVEEDNTVLLEKYFVITNPNKQADNTDVINVECKSLEHELTRKNLRSFNGVKKLYRTSAEIAAFEPSEMYPNLTSFIQSGILNVVISLCPSWSVGTVDSDLNEKFRDVRIDVKAIYDFLINDCGKMFDAIFDFDTINKTINVKKLDSIGINRGLFIDENYIKQFGENSDHAEIVTKLFLYGKDGLSINGINPTGTSYIENYSYYRNLTFMSQSLLDALDTYDALLATKQTEFSTLLSNLNTYTDNLATKQDELDILNSQLLTLELDVRDPLIQQGADLTSVNAQITAKETEIAAKETEITTVQNNITTTNSSISTLRNEIAKENNFTADQIIELDSFTRERDFVDSSYIDSQELYDVGVDILSRINQPPIQFSIGIADFLNSIENQHNWNKLKIGDIINIQYSKFNINIELRLIGYTHNCESNDLQLTFSNKSRLNDPSMVLEELLQNTISTSTSLDLNKFKYGRYEESNERTALMDYISSELDLAAQKAKAGKNQNIEIGRHGISCKDTTLSGEEIRILNNLIALTTDNWNTADVAITPEGINAKVIRGILGEFCTVRANQLIVGDEGETIPESLIENASLWNGTTTNFNNRNDRKSTTPANPTITLNGTAIDHTLNTDGSANISFEWNFSGTGDVYDIDGFFIYIYQSSSSSAYTFGTSVANETIYMLSADKRAFLLYGVPANMYYTFGVQAFRYVDTDINANNILKSSIIKSTYSGENPYRPSSSVAFTGDVTGTINGVAASTLQTQAGNSVQRDVLYNKVKISTTGGIQILDASNNERYKAGDLGSNKYGWYTKNAAGQIKAQVRDDGTLELIDGQFVINDGVRDRIFIGKSGTSYKLKLVDASGNVMFDIDDTAGLLDLKYKDGVFDGITNKAMYWSMIFGG